MLWPPCCGPWHLTRHHWPGQRPGCTGRGTGGALRRSLHLSGAEGLSSPLPRPLASTPAAQSPKELTSPLLLLCTPFIKIENIHKGFKIQECTGLSSAPHSAGTLPCLPWGASEKTHSSPSRPQSPHLPVVNEGAGPPEQDGQWGRLPSGCAQLHTPHRKALPGREAPNPNVLKTQLLPPLCRGPLRHRAMSSGRAAGSSPLVPNFSCDRVDIGSECASGLCRGAGHLDPPRPGRANAGATGTGWRAAGAARTTPLPSWLLQFQTLAAPPPPSVCRVPSATKLVPRPAPLGRGQTPPATVR